MRIVFLSHYSLPHVGGIETAIAGVAEEVAGRGHDVVHVSQTRARRASWIGGPPTATFVSWLSTCSSVASAFHILCSTFGCPGLFGASCAPQTSFTRTAS